MESTLTGIRDADVEILARADYPSLLRACQSDQYLRSICQDESLWAKKLFYDHKLTSKAHAPTFAQEYRYQYYNSLNPNAEAVKGNLSNLMTIWDLTGKLPTLLGVNMVAAKGDLRTLEWLASKGILPDTIGATNALLRKHWDVVDWLSSHEIRPTPASVRVLLDNDESMAEWLLQRRILPDVGIFDKLKETELIDRLIQTGLRPHPITMAFHGNLYSLERSLESNRTPNLTDIAISAAKGGSTNVLEWLVSKGVPLNNLVLHAAAESDKLSTVKWLEKHGLQPTPRNATAALEAGNLSILDHFFEQGIYPESYSVRNALERNDPKIRDWIQRHIMY